MSVKLTPAQLEGLMRYRRYEGFADGEASDPTIAWRDNAGRVVTRSVNSLIRLGLLSSHRPSWIWRLQPTEAGAQRIKAERPAWDARQINHASQRS